VPRLASATRLVCPAGSVWKTCTGCGGLFPAAPGETACRQCAPPVGEAGWCEAAHPDDRSPCEGPRDAVRIVDSTGGHALGCLRHAAVLLAALVGGRVYPLSVPGAAIEVYHRAARLRRCGAGGGR
jgi:hypothetical protein